MFDVAVETPIDLMEQRLLDAERTIARVRAAQGELLARLDRVEAYRADGAASLQEWTRARLDVSESTAADLVTAARTAIDRPDLAELAELRRMSFDRVVATARLVAGGADERTIERSFGFDLAGVARLRQQRRRTTRFDEAQTFRDRYLTLQPSLDRSHGRVNAEIPGVEFSIVEAAIVERADQFNDLPGPNIARTQRMADALVSLAQDSLDPTVAYGDTTAGARRSDPVVTVFVDAEVAAASKGEAGAEVAVGPKVGPLTLERILCTGAVQAIGLDNGRPVVASTAARAIPPAIRRFVEWRDGGCTIDGCNSRYRLEPHHVRFRSDGGSHDPVNLATLCWFHHHVVIHGMGMRLDPDSPPTRRRFLRHQGDDPDPP
jgi:hypothetical protein